MHGMQTDMSTVEDFALFLVDKAPVKTMLGSNPYLWSKQGYSFVQKTQLITGMGLPPISTKLENWTKKQECYPWQAFSA